MTRANLRHLLWHLVMLWGLLMLSPQAQAMYSCTVSATNASFLIDTFGGLYAAAQTTTGSAILTCTRASSDANTLSYRLKATDGLYSDGQSPYRRVRIGSSASYMDYALQRGSCTSSNTTNWRAPLTGTTDVQTGTLSFGSSLVASATVNYCIRIPAMWFPTAGQYTDAFEIFAQYPDSNTGALSASSVVNINAGMGEQCVFHTYPGSLVFSYTAFSASAQTASTGFVLRCNSSVPWSISVDPATTTLLGLRYQIVASPTSGTGNGSTGQAVTLTGTMQAGQAGTCNAPSCNGTQAHTVTISY